MAIKIYPKVYEKEIIENYIIFDIEVYVLKDQLPLANTSVSIKHGEQIWFPPLITNSKGIAFSELNFPISGYEFEVFLTNDTKVKEIIHVNSLREKSIKDKIEEFKNDEVIAAEKKAELLAQEIYKNNYKEKLEQKLAKELEKEANIKAEEIYQRELKLKINNELEGLAAKSAKESINKKYEEELKLKLETELSQKAEKAAKKLYNKRVKNEKEEYEKELKTKLEREFKLKLQDLAINEANERIKKENEDKKLEEKQIIKIEPDKDRTKVVKNRLDELTKEIIWLAGGAYFNQLHEVSKFEKTIPEKAEKEFYNSKEFTIVTNGIYKVDQDLINIKQRLYGAYKSPIKNFWGRLAYYENKVEKMAELNFKFNHSDVSKILFFVQVNILCLELKSSSCEIIYSAYGQELVNRRKLPSDIISVLILVPHFQLIRILFFEIL